MVLIACCAATHPCRRARPQAVTLASIQFAEAAAEAAIAGRSPYSARMIFMPATASAEALADRAASVAAADFVLAAIRLPAMGDASQFWSRLPAGTPLRTSLMMRSSTMAPIAGVEDGTDDSRKVPKMDIEAGQQPVADEGVLTTPTAMSPMRPKPVPSRRFDPAANQPAARPTNNMTRRLSLERAFRLPYDTGDLRFSGGAAEATRLPSAGKLVAGWESSSVASGNYLSLSEQYRALRWRLAAGRGRLAFEAFRRDPSHVEGT